jgi:DivIVA domain-containing protein
MPTSDLDLPLLPSSEQIRRREFATLRRGYDPDQVRDYLEAVAVQVETLEKDLKEARRQLEAKAAEPVAATPAAPAGDPYDRISKRFAGLLATADREASRIVDEAKTEADRVVIEAKTQADRIRTDAQSRAEQDRQEGHEVMESARDEADRILAGLGARRDLLVGQLQEMQSRLLSVAKDLEVVVESPPARGDDAGAMTGRADPMDADADEVDASIEHMTEAIETADEGAVTGSAADDALVDPRYEDLWVSGEESAPAVREVDLDQLFTGGEEGDDASVDIPDLASIELDFDEDRPDTAT